MLTDIPAKIRNGSAVVSVLGLGRVGLPLAIVIARSGIKVIGVDIDKQRLSSIEKGEMPFHYPALQEWLATVVHDRMLTVSGSAKEAIQKSDVVILTVGTPTGNQYQLDYSQLQSAIHEVLETDLRNKAILLRSTAVPGTTDTIVRPMLVKETGLQIGKDVALAVCPERILEGNAHRELYELPEIVGAADVVSADIASELFGRINPKKKIISTTPTGAELAKLFTNIYRYVNFAIANEFAIWSERYGEDAHEIVRVANDGYERSKIPAPGFAGGPCLGKDGFLLDNNTTFSSIISTAWKLNEGVPQHVVQSLMRELGPLYKVRVSVLGLAFKADSDDTRLSPSVKLVDILRAYGAEVLVHDPHVKGTETLESALTSPDVIILATNHSAFRNIGERIDESRCKIFYDVWGVYKPTDFKKARYMRFGKA
ncbi:MAG: nucleotide sugar dehydrogenase [Candidatus Bathyarchaeia archaeon]